MLGRFEAALVLDHMPKGAAIVFDALSIGTLIAIFLGHLPSVTSLLAFVWICLRLANEIYVWKKLRKETKDKE